MKKDLKRQFNSLKSIKPDQKWVSSTKVDILGEERSFFGESLQPRFAFSALACFSFLMFLIFFGSIGDYPEVTYSENRVTPRISRIVSDLKENNQEEVIMAVKPKDEPTLMTEISFDNLTEVEKRRMIRESTEELLEEINQLEERIIRVMAMRSE